MIQFFMSDKYGGGNKNLRLNKYTTLKNKKIVYARIYLESNKVFKEYLAETYPAMLKT